MIARVNVHRRNRRNLQISQAPISANVAATNTVSANKWAVAFNIPVQVASLPTTWTVNGAAPTAITITDAQHILLTYAVNVAAGQTYVIPANSPFIRTARGGFVNAASAVF